MPNIKVQNLSFMPGSHPARVSLVIADAENEEAAQVWIAARFPFQGRSDHKLAVLAQEVLQKLQTLIDEGITAAQAPPTGTV